MKKHLCILLVFLLLLSCFAGCSKGEEIGVTRPGKSDKAEKTEKPEPATEPEPNGSGDEPIGAEAPALGDDEPVLTDDELFSAYLPVLKSFRERILAYDWQNTSGISTGMKVAFADVYGDGAPEMIILCDSTGQRAGNIASLNIFTYRNYEVDRVYEGMIDGLVAGGCHYCLYMAGGELNLLMGYTDEDREGSILCFAEVNDALEEQTLAEYCFVPDYPGYEASFAIGGEICTSYDFEDYLTKTFEDIDTVLAYSALPSFYEGTVGVSQELLEGAAGMRYDEALDYIYARQVNPEIKVSQIKFDHKNADSKESAVISALAPDGSVVWSYKTAGLDCTELTRIISLGEYNDCYYMAYGGDVMCFDRETGNLRWTGAISCGAGCTWVFDEGGRLYICGYYGPGLLLIDASGRSVMYFQEFDSHHWWPYKMELSDGALYITFEGTDDGKTLMCLDLNSWDNYFIG